MLYMVELHYAMEHRDEALAYFWEHGSTHYAGQVAVKDAWISTQDQVAYALVKATNRREIDTACDPLGKFGKIIIREVLAASQF